MNIFDKPTRELASEQLTQIVLQDWIRELIQDEIAKFEQRRTDKALSAGAS